MEKEDIKIGMKVVPFQKSVGCLLDSCTNLQYAKATNQPFLYVHKFFFDEWCWVLGHNEEDLHDGDFFSSDDFEPYIEEPIASYLEDEFGILPNTIYKILFRSLENVKYRENLSDWKITALVGEIKEFNPTGIVAVDTSDGLQIISCSQIVQMLVVE